MLLFATLILWKERKIMICLVIFLAQYPQHVNSFVILGKYLQNNTNNCFKWFQTWQQWPSELWREEYGQKNPTKNHMSWCCKKSKCKKWRAKRPNCLRGYNKMPQTGLYKQPPSLFLPLLESGKSKIKVPADSVSGGRQLPSSQTDIFSLCPHMAEGAKELSGISFMRALIPFLRAALSWPKPPPQSSTT